MTLRKKIFSTLFLFGFVLFLFPRGIVEARVPTKTSLNNNPNGDTPKCWPLDIVVLIDQSGSMSDNDPEGYRFDAAREVLDELIFNKQEQCGKTDHRISIITFGEDAVPYLSLGSGRISIEENEDANVWAEENYLKDITRAENTHLQTYTDFKSAFKEAQNVFMESAGTISDPDDYGERRKIVVLITDGKPTTNGTQSVHMCDLKSQLEEPFWQSKSIWVVALNAEEPYLDQAGCKGNTIRQDFSQMAQSHGGELLDLPYNVR